METLFGLTRSTTAPAEGSNSCNSSSRFPVTATALLYIPVTLASGRLRLVTRQALLRMASASDVAGERIPTTGIRCCAPAASGHAAAAVPLNVIRRLVASSEAED